MLASRNPHNLRKSFQQEDKFRINFEELNHAGIIIQKKVSTENSLATILETSYK